ncbi:MAG: hypothetical protein KDB27_31435 [Planctomycetales bacterium]|nr:hypothetical protein [Planctomycetales bacterium]
MGKSFRLVLRACVALGVSAYVIAEDGEEQKPKHTIEQVMEKALKGGGLNKKVADGKASNEEKLQLLDMYISLLENKPPKGDNASWQKLAGATALAAAKVAVGRPGAEAELKKATNCKACHSEHKPAKKE